MDTLHLFLEGPGRETIPVTPLNAEPHNGAQFSADAMPHALIDGEGNIATRTDKSGYRYQFGERFGTWSLIVSD